ncbi:MAG: tripartite tricarboxylate transporter TctB family protein [Burkholderiales bacterium]|nr:tripartite tricarboxylate transporter TctB family protein [Burkholderiales bacterium]
MSENNSSGESQSGISMRAAELTVAAFLLLIGGMVIYDSVRLGAKWGGDGPEAGYFPFYIGLLICIGTVLTVIGVLRNKDGSANKLFVEWGALRQIMQVLIPAAFYVLGIQLIGIYAASAAYIALFMVYLGKYSWIKGVVLGVAVSALTYAMFEVWFKVPLFKGEFNPLSLIGL